MLCLALRRELELQ